MNCLLGIESGTTYIKLGIVSTEGNLIKKTNRHAKIDVSENNTRAVADAAHWWELICDMLQEIAPTLKDHNLKGIAAGSHGPTVVSLDRDLNPLLPSILWMDKRAARQAELISEKLGKKTNDLTWFVPRVLWLKETYPNEFKKIKYFCQPLDYISCKLTGKLTASKCSDEIKPWDKETIKAANLDQSMFPEYRTMGEFIGHVSNEASKATGLPAGVPVFSGTGGADFVQELIGAGSLKNGMICDRGGTSQGIEFCWHTPGDKFKFFSVKHPIIKDSFHVAGLMATTGKSLHWFKDTYYDKNISYDDLIQEALKSPAGAGKLIFLPSLMGIRTPWWDTEARGVFMGITLSHKKEDFLRAVLEGTALGINQAINIFVSEGFKPTEIRVCGAQSKSPIWNQIKSDVTGLPVKITSTDDSSTLGLAIIAGNGAGIFKSIADTANEFVKVKRIFKPDGNNHKLYSQMQNIYDDLYPSLKNNFKKLAEITNS